MVRPVLQTFLVITSLALFIISVVNLTWLLQAWRSPQADEETRFPPDREPSSSFSLIVPARHEERVLGGTLQRIVASDHPAFEVFVVVGDDDPETLLVAEAAQARHPEKIRVLVDRSSPKSKPAALNTALRECSGDIIAIFDAEDDISPGLLRAVDSCFQVRCPDIVQGGVQLVDHDSHWYSLRNVLEYYFWFRSRLQLQARHGFFPLGGNTVFLRADLVRDNGGWDPEALTEDCDLGVRLSARGAKVAVAYDPDLVTREETPHTVGAFVRQRTRWMQGFLQVLRRGTWRRFRSRPQRLLAWYTLASPFLQALAGLLIPLSVALALVLKAPIQLAMMSFVPAVITLTALAVEAAALGEFGSSFGKRCSLGDYIRLVWTTLPYQALLALAAMRAVGREFHGVRNWEKTAHWGVHRPGFLSGPLVELAGMPGFLAPPLAGPHPSMAPMPFMRTDRGRTQTRPVSLSGSPHQSLSPLRVNDGREIRNPPSQPGSAAPSNREWGSALRHGIGRHWKGAVVFLVVLIAVGVIQAKGMYRAPGFDDDEGTYVSQAFAVQVWHRLAPYTYLYDHPPLGWILLSAWTWVTSAFSRFPAAVDAGREFMLVVQLANCTLLFALARRLRMERVAAAAAVLLFSLSPLGLYFHRMVYLDNIAVSFVLASFVLAASPGKRLWAHASSGLMFALAVLTKETTLILLPALVWQLAQNLDPRTRRFSLALFCSFFLLGAGLYPLFALLRGELVPGEGHVSLMGSVAWQLFGRASSGSVLDPSSAARATVNRWLSIDPWLFALALPAALAALAIGRLRPVAAALAIQLVLLLRPGYLPAPYVIGMLPFASLILAGMVGVALGGAFRRARLAGSWRGRIAWAPPIAAGLLSAFTASILVAPSWIVGDEALMSRVDNATHFQTMAWIERYVPRGETMLVDDTYWLDLVRAGFEPARTVWFYKLDLDPAVRDHFGHGWRDFGYVVSTPVMRSQAESLPQVRDALDHSVVVASFDQGGDRVEIRKIVRYSGGKASVQTHGRSRSGPIGSGVGSNFRNARPGGRV